MTANLEKVKEGWRDLLEQAELDRQKQEQVEVKQYGVRLVQEKTHKYLLNDIKLNSPESAVKFINHAIELHIRLQEVVAMVTLDIHLKPTGIFEVSTGSINASIATPRQIFQRAILQGANTIMLFHNHPSNDCSPSSADINLTKRAVKAGEVLGINVLDHIIVTNDSLNYFSFKAEGYISNYR